ncbi:S41 family peptidase [Adhaeribacter pallidiroseus]|uniref:C-terminal processing peptidase n=1 Tax=Adhaeribacter pallidiroseus TaxID=2072847 RepID=A0A369QEA6_9BACT|nr:S41 family peptidase [Adhaeribacter pallidiroseus]RDC61526.1 C-terminal processing peptidase [Adhaeribacter pallidiroseus]
MDTTYKAYIGHIVFMFLVLVLNPAFCQQLNFDLTDTKKYSVIQSASQILNDNYLFPNKAKKIEKLLNEKFKAGDFEKVADPKAFGKELQLLMQEVTLDKHLRILYSPNMVKELEQVKTKQDSLKLYKEDFTERKKSNFGLPEAKVLENNIGYLKISKFTSPEMAGPVMMASSIFLKHVDGLILDLRSRGGGNSYTLALLLSYFLPPNMLLYTWHFRGTAATEQSWTLPYVEGHRFLEIPILILTSKETFSASEAFCYSLQAAKRATIVGEKTVGGAHTYKEMKVTKEYIMTVPYGRLVNQHTNTNWEAVGVIPDHEVPAEKALEKAQELLVQRLNSSNK